MEIEVRHVRRMHFHDGAPVRAASALQRLGRGWIVAQDDAVNGAWYRDGELQRLRLLPPVDGHEVFSEADGTKHLKPDLEAACEVDVDGEAAVLLLGSGSSSRRTRAVLVRLHDGEPHVDVADLSALYPRVAAALDLPPDGLNLEGACSVGDRLRWFHRGSSAAGVPSASVDVDRAALVAAVVAGGAGADRIAVEGVQRYDLGEVEGVGMAITDAVALPGDRILVSAAAEDTPNAVDDGRVTGSALALIEDGAIVAVARVPHPDDGPPWKIEGLAVLAHAAEATDLRGVVDADDAEAASALLDLRVRWR